MGWAEARKLTAKAADRQPWRPPAGRIPPPGAAAPIAPSGRCGSCTAARGGVPRLRAAAAAASAAATPAAHGRARPPALQPAAAAERHRLSCCRRLWRCLLHWRTAGMVPHRVLHSCRRVQLQSSPDEVYSVSNVSKRTAAEDEVHSEKEGPGEGFVQTLAESCAE